jgi:hypothetical protein
MKLSELASTIRSKNAGVDHVTFDIIFRDRDAFTRTVESGAINTDSVAKLYGLDRSRVASFVVFEPAQAIKFTIRRERPAGSAGGPDPFGSQFYPPLFDLDIP